MTIDKRQDRHRRENGAEALVEEVNFVKLGNAKDRRFREDANCDANETPWNEANHSPMRITFIWDEPQSHHEEGIGPAVPGGKMTGVVVPMPKKELVKDSNHKRGDNAETKAGIILVHDTNCMPSSYMISRLTLKPKSIIEV